MVLGTYDVMRVADAEFSLQVNRAAVAPRRDGRGQQKDMYKFLGNDPEEAKQKQNVAHAAPRFKRPGASRGPAITKEHPRKRVAAWRLVATRRSTSAPR